jgi:O-antigen ligase
MGRAAPAAVPLVLVPTLGAVQGGFLPDAWVWAGALAAWAAALGLTLADRSGGWLWPGIAIALLLWTLASALWSAEPAQSLLEARRTLVYAAVVLALVVLARRSSTWALVLATHLALTGLIVYALFRYLLGPRVHETFEGFAISEPLGYSNAVGVLAAIGIVLALGPLGERDARSRALAGASVPPLAVALALSGSRASWLALALGFAVVAALAPAFAVPAAAVAPPTAAAVWLADHSLFSDTATPRIGGAALLAATLGAAVISALGAGLVPPRSKRPRLVAPALLPFLTQPRLSYYHVAWHEYLAHPLLGSGAGTFGRYWIASAPAATLGGALDAHSLYLETLAELGPLGLVLLLLFLLYPLRTAIASRAVRGAPAATGAAIVFLVHAGLDWDWELPAVVVAGLGCLAAVLFAAEPERSLPRPVRAAALAVALALGAAAIAGTASSARPSAKGEAPLGGASSKVG